jgi:hypothetical protein
MPPNLMQWNFIVHNLIGGNVNIPKKFWLKKGEILLKQEGNYVKACVLTEHDEYGFGIEEKILPYLKTCSLIANVPRLEDGGGQSLAKKSDFGKEIKILKTVPGGIGYPKSAKRRIQKHIKTYLDQIKFLHKKYYSLISENIFLKTSMDYLYESRINSVYKNEGFVNAMMSLEALFNEGSGDITYKLQQRASFILGFSKFSSSEVFERFKEFYKLRNAIVHGGEMIPKVKNKYDIGDYARISLIVFLILCGNPKRKKIQKNNRKKAILDEIDKGMLDVSNRRFLENEIKKGLNNFKLKVPRKFEGKGEYGPYRLYPW